MTTTRDTLQLALEALELCNKNGWMLADYESQMYDAIEALRTELAKTEPPAPHWVCEYCGKQDMTRNREVNRAIGPVLSAAFKQLGESNE